VKHSIRRVSNPVKPAGEHSELSTTVNGCTRSENRDAGRNSRFFTCYATLRRKVRGIWSVPA
jgi:hypothetical protein